MEWLPNSALIPSIEMQRYHSFLQKRKVEWDLFAYERMCNTFFFVLVGGTTVEAKRSATVERLQK